MPFSMFELVQGILATSTTCTVCRQVSVVREEFAILPVHLHAATLEGCMTPPPERLEGDNAYNCDFCGVRVPLIGFLY